MIPMSFFMLLSILIIITINYTSYKFLASFSFSSFSEELSCSFIWVLFFVFPFWLLLCICFYDLVDLQILWCKLVSNVACDWSWAMCLELSAIHSLWLPLLGLGMSRKNQADHLGWLLFTAGSYLGSFPSSGVLC